MERQCQCAKPHEACGIFGIAVSGDDRRDPAAAAYNALFALQHRGQESAGIAVRTDRGLLLHKHAGLVPEVFSAQILESFRGAAPPSAMSATPGRAWTRAPSTPSP